jgi:hypothetical protein
MAIDARHCDEMSRSPEYDGNELGESPALAGMERATVGDPGTYDHAQRTVTHETRSLANCQIDRSYARRQMPGALWSRNGAKDSPA